MMTNLQIGDVVILKENSLSFKSLNNRDVAEDVMCGQLPMKVSRIDRQSSQKRKSVLLRTSFEHDLEVRRCLIDKPIGNVHDWFARCGSCSGLSKGGGSVGSVMLWSNQTA